LNFLSSFIFVDYLLVSLKFKSTCCSKKLFYYRQFDFRYSRNMSLDNQNIFIAVFGSWWKVYIFFYNFNVNVSEL